MGTQQEKFKLFRFAASFFAKGRKSGFDPCLCLPPHFTRHTVTNVDNQQLKP
jgi:hypothetical protein